MPQDNVQTLREIDEAQRKGDPEALFSHFTDDVQVHLGGNNKLAGDYDGKGKMQEVFGRFMEAAGSDYSFETHAHLADDEHGVTLQISHYKKGSETLVLQEAFIYHFRDGKVSELWHMPVDGAAYDAWIGR